MRFHDILCPVDFSECSRAAFRRAIDLAKESGATLHLHNVFELPDVTGSPHLPNLLRDAERGADGSMATWVAEAKEQGVADVIGSTELGVAWESIVRLANNEGVDLIVMGTHGRKGVAHVLVGSVAERVTRHAGCNVMIVKADTSGAA